MEENPISVMEEFPESGDLSTQTGGEAIEGVKGVRFIIRNVEPKLQKDDNGQLLAARLNVRAAIGPMGVDGSGKYAGKNLFAELLTWYSEERYTSDWWKKQARFPYKSFLKAMGYDPASPPKVNDEFVIGLQNREFIADVVKEEIQQKTSEVNEKGKAVYVGTGDFKNVLKNFKAAV